MKFGVNVAISAYSRDKLFRKRPRRIIVLYAVMLYVMLIHALRDVNVR